MSFSPLPEIFLKDLHKACDAVVDVGCGDGRLSAELLSYGVRPLGLDRRRPATGSVADVVADALHLPLRPGSVSVLVAANLWRHLGSPDRRPLIPGCWLESLRDDGCLYIFEDELDDERPAPRNYRRVQQFLSRLDPGRAPLTGAAEFRRLASDDGWTMGGADNALLPDRDAVLRMLAGKRLEPGGDVARLHESIATDGIAYGKFWWARWQGKLA